MSMVTPKGFSFGTTSAGFKSEGRRDLAVLVSEVPAVSAGVFTTNLFKAAPVLVGQQRIGEKGTARVVLINSGQANACTGPEGLDKCRETVELLSSAMGVDAADVLPASTGVIGTQLKMDKWRSAVPALAASVGEKSLEDFASAIMTTDAFPKFASESVTLSGGDVALAGAAKGAGMICPNMATMLSTVICDAAVAVEDWRAMFRRAVDRSFNRATVDGDTSTNDTLYGLANGASGVQAKNADDLRLLEDALTRILSRLAYMLVQDGEGATKVIHIKVTGAATEADAEKAARTVGHSQLVKTAMYGKDANWGRIVAALGRSGADFAPADVRVSLCGVELFKNEQPSGLDFDALLKEPLEQRDLYLDIVLGGGNGEYELLASDLTHEYVTINGDYRS